jgi:ribosomal protein L29
MAILRSKEISKMNEKERNEKIKDLKMELVKNKIDAGKGGKMKGKEIKRTIARLHTFNRLNKSVENK